MDARGWRRFVQVCKTMQFESSFFLGMMEQSTLQLLEKCDRFMPINIV